jgi:hypothetical protein
MMNATGFREPRLGVFCCGHVFRREREVKLVLHEKEDWQFMCGGADHFGADGNFVLVKVLLNFDPSLDEVATCQPGGKRSVAIPNRPRSEREPDLLAAKTISGDRSD